jgi:hypothetical protein
MWMTNGRRFHIKLTRFAQILGLSSQLDIPKKLHSGRVMVPREMTTMYIPNSDFWAPMVDGLLPHFLVLSWDEEEDSCAEDWIFISYSGL